ncbi:hypothetical protein [Candidatus Liberibacter sp.]|uniref:hypothetical protein n=1 Tax=Candidatus Liberibacter sp. TaxID=34022 RepID=UPI0015F3FA13|nr:hypothetical protein [Candidatus Liberibacter sp.]MBA5723654.1 hypothetical protein [Candidatus Liberibacter sp.]
MGKLRSSHKEAILALIRYLTFGRDGIGILVDQKFTKVIDTFFGSPEKTTAIVLKLIERFGCNG